MRNGFLVILTACAVMISGIIAFAGDESQGQKVETDKVEETSLTTAEHRKNPKALIQHTSDRVVGLLKKRYGDKPEISDEEMVQGIRQALLSATDMELVSKSTLARYRNKFTPQQFELFQVLFTDLLFSTYIDNLRNYDGEKVEIMPARKLRDNVARVETKAVGEKKEIPIEYSLVMKDGLWSVYDLKVEGVSLVRNYRTQFAEILQKDSAAELLEMLEKKVAEKKEKNE